MSIRETSEPVDIETLADFDKLFLSERGGEQSILFGFSACLFYEGGSTVERRLDGNKTLAKYYEMFRSKINYFHPKGSRHHRKIGKKDPFEYYNSDAQRSESVETYGAGLYGFPEAEGVGRATPYFAANVGSAHFKVWSHYTSYFASSWVAQKGYPAFIDLMLDWCNLLRPGHGTAGLSFLLDEGSGIQSQCRLAFPLVKRFPGLDFPDLSSWNSEVRREKKRWIRTINWLTILDDKFVEELGGLDKLKAALGDDCPIHAWNGGIIIQAGAEPEIGDVNQGAVPEAYRKVARVTKPLRFEGFEPGYGIIYPPQSSPGLDSVEESLKWIRRFD